MTSQLQISIMQASLLSDNDLLDLLLNLNKRAEKIGKPKNTKTLTVKQKIKAGIITADI